MPVIFLKTTGDLQNWTVPRDWNSADNTIEVLGGGGGPAGSLGDVFGGSAAAGADYAKVTNLPLTPGALVPYSVGPGGNPGANDATASLMRGQDGGDSWFNGSTLAGSSVGARGGRGATINVHPILGSPTSSSPGLGGDAALSIGTVKFPGGDGGQGPAASNPGGAGAGAAAGPHGPGADGGPCINTSNGSGGGGADGGENGEGASSSGPGAGGDNREGEHGGDAGSGNGSDGGGGGGGLNTQPGGNGSNETLWTQTSNSETAGPGSGPGGGGRLAAAGQSPSTSYGAGGAAAGEGGTPRAGRQGIIVITYTPNISLQTFFDG